MFYAATTASIVSSQDIDLQHLKKEIKQGLVSQGKPKDHIFLKRRLLVGPGSSPPTCIAKCNECTPCTPILVTVPPKKQEEFGPYYPQVWKCTCDNQLYDP
ncbi:EPIDERMAL PATTERNING FACTOR-like protein 6 [Vicia villosa]|uniref:EPIDERMAL PATTERNING FACTOR-like protein 6 n=1 Tax=Vicia villosa TaxID=3911 RepID=UPI00273B3350|nr:EPIDERMAL PATTERNING FACTOR-like protein 6 [Vicia villosa]